MKDLLNKIRIDLAQEFDRNFERKAFFYQKWKPSKNNLQQTGALRRSIKSAVQGNAVAFTSSLPYASIHNHGGRIRITQRMKRFFWAMYYKASNAQTYNAKTRQLANNTKNTRLSKSANQYKAMALMPIGKQMNIPQRQFIGPHPKVRLIIKQHCDQYVQQIAQKIIKK